MAYRSRVVGVMTAAAAAAAMMGAVPGEAVAGPAPEAARPAGTDVAANGRLRTSEVEPGRYELIYSGRRLKAPRAGIEQYLLYRAGLLARQKGAVSFSLLHLPGEEGPESHPASPGPSSGPGYGHWQPHWTYYVTGLGWQPWHPEWGAAFWADNIDLARVEKYEVHAIVALGGEEDLDEDQPEFRVDEVIRDLEPRYR
jgi:hypothetical protein